VRTESTLLTYFAKTGANRDGDNLIITFNDNEFFIVNKNAEIIKHFSYKYTQNERLRGVYWLKSGIYFIIMNNENLSVPTWELRLVNPDNSQSTSLILKQNGGAFINSENPLGTSILVSSGFSPPSYNHDMIELKIVNLLTKNNENIFWVDGRICITSGSDKNYTAFQIAEPGEPCGGKTNLWVFDWNDEKITQYQEITALLGWRELENGFAVISGMKESGFILEIIRPK
jgi:hypothetical protein